MQRISIIVPIYKVEKFLNRCVNSIVNQTYQNLEIILVDDGSPDRCGDMCDEWAKKDRRIHVIHKVNGGLSDARNAGIEKATGKYIAFVDSDDWISPLFIEQLYNTMQQTKCDVVECEILRITGNETDLGQDIGAVKCYNTSSALEQLIKDGAFHQYVWNKLYRKEILAEISFPIGKMNEDEFWTYQIFGRAKKITKLNKVLYYYFQRENSIMGAQYSLKRLDALEAKLQRQSYIEKRFPELSVIAKANLFGSCIYSGQMILKCLEREEKKKAIHIVNRVKKEINSNHTMLGAVSGMEKIWMELAFFNFWGTCWIKNLLKKGF